MGQGARDISHVLEEIVFEPFTTSLLDHAKTAANAFSALSAKHETLKHQITELRTRAAEQAAQYQADIARISSGLAAERQAMNNAINEADRLRAELAAERQAREALQEQANAVDVKDAAVGYLIRVPKRDPILRRKLDSARLAAGRGSPAPPGLRCWLSCRLAQAAAAPNGGGMMTDEQLIENLRARMRAAADRIGELERLVAAFQRAEAGVEHGRRVCEVLSVQEQALVQPAKIQRARQVRYETPDLPAVRRAQLLQVG